MWVTGESSIYSNWNAGEPNNAGNEDYVMLDYDASYAWNDVFVGLASPFIVEFETKLDAGPTPTPIVQEVIEAATPTPASTAATAPEAAKRGGTLTIAIVADHVSLDPRIPGLSVTDGAITQATYDNLLMIQPDFSVKPELATSWEANEDFSSYTFHLRKGVKFHHGKDFKAEDVLFTFNRLLDPEVDAPARANFLAIEDTVILDDYTVRFDLTGPNSFFWDSLSNYQARILPADVDVNRLNTEEFGTGPFIIAEHLPGERTVLVRNSDYWEEGKPYLDEIVIQVMPEAATRVAALKSGDVDVVYDLASQSAADIEMHPGTKVLEVSSLSWIGMPMRTDTPPFDSKLVRKAFQAATDREAIRQAALLGRGQIAHDHPIHPSDPRFAPQYAPPDYDPDLARSLL